MLDKNNHEEIIGKLLRDIYTDKELSLILGFKGGTACYLFYNLPRFSVDLDFDLLEEEKINAVFEKIVSMVKNYGEVKDSWIKFNSILVEMAYDLYGQNVKVEISTRETDRTKYEIKNYLGLPILTLKRQYMAAQKLLTITTRKKFASRDLFDARFFLQNNWPIDEQTIENISGKSSVDYFEYLILFIEGKGKIDILRGLGELVDSKKEKAWIKNNLVNDLLFLLRLKTKGLKGG